MGMFTSPVCAPEPIVFPLTQPKPDSDEFFFSNASPTMSRIQVFIERVAQVDVPVLLLGESGVGKGVVARRIHKISPRAHRSMVQLNCAAFPADLLESELFGYEAGAFTGANRAKPGLLELANKGTILLDEIGDMPPALQAKILHVLQDRQFSRLGARSFVTVDARILSATNVDVQQALASKKLREDLYYRLSAFTIHIPPLRERKDEIPGLLNFFVQRLGERMGRTPQALSLRAVRACRDYDWPGNIRELENFVKRYVILEDEEALLAELQSGNYAHGHTHLAEPVKSSAFSEGQLPDLKAMVQSLKAEAEKEAIKLALERAQGKRTEAARLLKISTKALLYKLRRYGIAES